MWNGKSYIKESSDFINKIKSINSLPRDAIIVKVDALGLYLLTPYMNLRKNRHSKDFNR